MDTVRDPVDIMSEAWGVELRIALQSAVNGDPHWRMKANMLLGDIHNLRLPLRAFKRLREIDDLKRAAEQMGDIVHA